jgi:hypothetical protein
MPNMKCVPQIEKNYGIKINDFSPAPRGYCAETYYADSNIGRLFIKVYLNPRFKENVFSSLDAQYAIAEKVDFIPKPLKKTDGGFMLETENSCGIVIYNCIDGEDFETETGFELMPLLAEIYKLRLECKTSEKFILPCEQKLDNIFNGNTFISKELKNYLEKKSPYIVEKWNYFKNLSRVLAGRKSTQYITHSDAAGNLMADKSGKLFIVDWDDIMLAPIERDIWFFINDEKNRNEIQNILHENGIPWEHNREYHRYYIYKRFFEDLYDDLEKDIMGTEKPDALVRDIEEELEVWLFPLMDMKL